MDEWHPEAEEANSCAAKILTRTPDAVRQPDGSGAAGQHERDDKEGKKSSTIEELELSPCLQLLKRAGINSVAGGAAQ